MTVGSTRVRARGVCAWSVVRMLAAACAAASVVGMAAPVRAQTRIGSITWQMQPYCNRVTFEVTQTGSVFTLDGFDDQCGAAVHAAAAGVASLNPDGTVNLGFSIITPEDQVIGWSDAGVIHVDATVDLATIGGTWRDSGGLNGTLAFNGSAPGNPRPSSLARLSSAGGFFGRNTSGAFFIGLGHQGTFAAPQATTNNNVLGMFAAGGYTSAGFELTGIIQMMSAENWTPTAAGTRMLFGTTGVGSVDPSVRMVIDANGFVAIGEFAVPLDRLHVRGNIRVGTSGTNGCLKNNNGGTIVGTCASDERFKRDVMAFTNVLPRVTALRPVTFSWRADAFPERGFGPGRETGLIAQQVEQVLPELVTTDEDGYKAVNYSTLPLLAIQAIKELKTENDTLKTQLAEVLQRLSAIETREKEQ